MRISRWYVCLAVAIAASLVIVPAVAFAAGPLTNEWGQTFLGSGATTVEDDDGCIACHNDEFGGIDYNKTTHGQFAKVEAEPAAGSGMWPAGMAGKGATVAVPDFTLGGGTGLREYLKFGNENDSAGIVFNVPSLEWDPSEPTLWEMSGVDGVEWEDYGCNQCHMLGATKVGVKRNDTTATANAWAMPVGADAGSVASYLPGLGIQCERCHGTGIAATTGDHWSTGVKVVGYNTGSGTAKVSSNAILNSEVCGQCHGTFKSGNIAGYTPDQNINAFVTAYTPAEAPTVTNRFWPNGQNKGMKHSYYSEWVISGHSVRGFYSATATDPLSGLPLTSTYQQSGASHYTSAGASRLFCNRCHTGEGYLKRKGAEIMSGWVEGTDPAGKLGQECAVCHISHGDVGATDTESAEDLNEAVGMAVRAPEKANGLYSTLGLSVDNQSICEDCHNWQREVANGGSAPSLPATPTAAAPVSKYVSHPTREIYHGRALLEVPAAADFMPGAKCEQCHMPATKSDFPAKTDLPRYADRSWKRYSHRMFIMMPGDAKAWGLAPWGDSCSPCHAGETQDQLQANIDEWQATATSLVAEATAAISAAVTRGDAASAGDVDLLKRATANVSMVMNDGSMGVHNPPYEQAGLKKAVALAKSAGGSVSITAPVKVGAGALFGIQGMVMNGDGTHAAGVTVKLYDGTTLAGTSVTDANGNYAFAYAQNVGKTYTVKWARSSQAVSDVAVSATVGVDMPKVATDLDLTINKRGVTRTYSYRLNGNIDPAFAGASIDLYYKLPGSSSYVKAATVVTAADGTFTYVRKTYRSTTVGTWTWRAKFTGDATHLGSAASAKILVK